MTSRNKEGQKFFMLFTIILIILWSISIMALSPLVGVSILQSWTFPVFMLCGAFFLFASLTGYCWYALYLKEIEKQLSTKEFLIILRISKFYGLISLLLAATGIICLTPVLVGWLAVFILPFYGIGVFGIGVFIEYGRFKFDWLNKKK
jgi:hypothetical protein